MEKFQLLPNDVRQICRRAAAQSIRPGAWAEGGFIGLDSNGNPADVYTKAVARDGYGWILKESYDFFTGRLRRRRRRQEIGHKVAEIIDSQIRINTMGRLRLITVCDQGPTKTAVVLMRVARTIHHVLPPLFRYGQVAPNR